MYNLFSLVNWNSNPPRPRPSKSPTMFELYKIQLLTVRYIHSYFSTTKMIGST